MYLGVGPRAPCGGATNYLAPEEPGEPGEPGEAGAAAGEALVSLPPVDNALNLVYCDAGAASFTKYVSRLTPHRFYLLHATYAE